MADLMTNSKENLNSQKKYCESVMSKVYFHTSKMLHKYLKSKSRVFKLKRQNLFSKRDRLLTVLSSKYWTLSLYFRIQWAGKWIRS